MVESMVSQGQEGKVVIQVTDNRAESWRMRSWSLDEGFVSYLDVNAHVMDDI